MVEVVFAVYVQCNVMHSIMVKELHVGLCLSQENQSI